jgi:IS1 family transposase
MPAERHQAMTQQARETHRLERFNKTLQHRVSRLIRETLSCSNTLAHHSGALTYGMCP